MSLFAYLMVFTRFHITLTLGTVISTPLNPLQHQCHTIDRPINQFSLFGEEAEQNVLEVFRSPLFLERVDYDEDAEKLSEEGQTAFHHLVAKTLYISKRARPDLSTAIAFLTTRVKAPDTHDWRKLSHMMEYLRVERLRPLILSADGSGVLMWYVDASFAVHPNMRSHTGGGLTMGRGFPIVTSTSARRSGMTCVRASASSRSRPPRTSGRRWPTSSVRA